MNAKVHVASSWSQLAAWELVAAAVAAAALAAYQSRPRGWSRKDLLEVSVSACACVRVRVRVCAYGMR